MLSRGGGADGQAPIFVSADTAVEYHFYAIHRQQDIYGPDADEYRPERWETLQPGWGHLPFSGGPRACIGRESTLSTLSTHF